jgi:hypothetical protein
MTHSYVANSNKTNTVSSTAPMWNLLGSATRRLHVYEIIVASDATPGDQASKFALMRTTARGTQSTTIAPNALNPESPASIANLDTAWSVDPTITALSQLLQFALNQRATFRWVAVPGSEIIVPATANAGLALVSVVSTGPVNFAFSIFWKE